MGAVQDAQEAVGGAGLFKGQRSTACKAGTGGSGLAVQFFGDSQRVAVGIGNGIGEAEGCVLLSQTRGAGVDGRGHIVSDRAYSGRGVARLQALGVVCLDPIHHGGPAVGDGVGVGQRVALVHLRVGGATIGAALQNVAAQVAIIIRAFCPRDRNVRAAHDGRRNGNVPRSRGRGVSRDRAIVRYQESRGQYKSGANTVGVAVPVVAGLAIDVNAKDADVIADVRRAQPPNGSAAAVVGDTLVDAVRAVVEVRQPNTILGEIAVVSGRKANLITRQQEYFRAHAIGAGGKASAGTSAVLVRDFHLLNSRPDVAVDEVVERSVQVCVDAGILVGVIVAERGRGVDVLHQQPRSIATRIIGAGVRVALLHNNKIFGRAVDFDFDNAANGFRAQFYVCHKNSPPYSKFNPCLFGVPHTGYGQAVKTAECGAERVLGHVRAEFEIN